MKEQLEESQNAVIAVEEPPPETKRKHKNAPREETNNRREPNYHVIIWNDDDHSFDYVIEMLMELFAHTKEKAKQIAAEVDREGKGIAMTCHKELAELKRDQIHAYRQDWVGEIPIGPIKATIEPARPNERNIRLYNAARNVRITMARNLGQLRPQPNPKTLIIMALSHGSAPRESEFCEKNICPHCQVGEEFG